MQFQAAPLKPLSGIQLTPDDQSILKWIRNAKWEPQAGQEPIFYKAKVPEFYNGVKFFKVQAGAASGAGAMGAVDVFIKKIEYQGVISKQGLYPVITEGGARFLQLRKADLNNLGVGAPVDEDEL